MQWPEETNAVAGGDTFWTLITRDCCIILNWVHLKKSRIIFFVIVTYWQSMARFRKNDFFKWAQKIKSVFCFNPHTHEGCDSIAAILYHGRTCFNPHTHEGCDSPICTAALMIFQFQSTHPRRVWPHAMMMNNPGLLFQSTHPRRVWHDFVLILSYRYWFQSTHPRRVWRCSSLRFTTLVTFQSTHPRRVWQKHQCSLRHTSVVSIHTPTKGVT